MKEYDLYVPLFSNGDKRLPRASLARLQKQLVAQFGGLAFFPQKSKGVWKIGRAVFQDEIVILRVLSEKDFPSFWKQLKKDLQREWKQKEILIVVRQVNLLTD
jgi:hypothetical protein